MKSKKTVIINGMHCSACAARVEKAFSALDEVKAKVDLKKSVAVLTAKDGAQISDDKIKAIVISLGFEVGEIKE